MEISRAVEDLDCYSYWPRCFSLSEAADSLQRGITRVQLRSLLHGHPEVMCLRTGLVDDEYFIFKSVLFRWFTDLNTRLARLGLFSVAERHLASELSQLRREGRWHSMPPEAVRWAQHLGLIGASLKPEEYVFPLARVFSFMLPGSFYLLSKVLYDLADAQVWRLPLLEMSQAYLREGLSLFPPHIARIVKERAPFNGRRKTLEQLGETLGLTRERIRQLEQEFWGALSRLGEEKRRPFIGAFLCSLMDGSGKLVLSARSPEAQFGAFLGKAIGMPRTELRKLGILLLAFDNKEVKGLLVSCPANAFVLS